MSEYVSTNADLWIRGCMAEELTSSEDVVFTSIAMTIMRYQFTRWDRSRIGISTARPDAGPDFIARNRYNYPGINAVWELRPVGGAEFREAVNERYKLLLESNAEQSHSAVLCGK